MADIDIESAANKAASVTNDGVTVTQRSMADLIAADKYKRSIEAASDRQTMLGGIISKIIAPGGH